LAALYPAVILYEAVGAVERDDEREARESDSQCAEAGPGETGTAMPQGEAEAAAERERHEQEEGRERFPPSVTGTVADRVAYDEREGKEAERRRTPEDVGEKAGHLCGA